MAADVRSHRLRLAVLTLASLGALAGLTGLSERAMFSQASPLKWGLSVAVPLLLAVCAMVREPLIPLAAATVLAIPFAGASAQLAGLALSPLLLLLIAGGAVAITRGPAVARRSMLGRVAPLALGLLTIPVLLGRTPSRSVELIAYLVATAWLVARASALPRGLTVMLAAIVASAALQASLAIWQSRTGNLLNLYGTSGQPRFGQDYFFQYEGENRPTGAFFDPISLGNALALACPLAVALAASRSGLSTRLRLGAAVAGGLAASALILTLSRMSWIAAATGILATVLLLPPSRRVRAAIGVAATGVVVIVVAAATLGSGLTQRFESILHPRSSATVTAEGDNQRIQFWDAALATAERHPIAGIGVEQLAPRLQQFPDTGPDIHAHSTYLQLLAEGGGLAIVALGAILVGAFVDLAEALRRRREQAAGAVGALLALLIVWSTDYTLRYVSVAATFAALLGVVSAVGRPATPSVPRPAPVGPRDRAPCLARSRLGRRGTRALG